MRHLFYIIIFSLLAGCGSPYYTGPKSNHFDGKKFYNLIPEPQQSWTTKLKWFMTREVGKWPDKTLRVYSPKLQQRVFDNRIIATYISHATVLIQTQGLNILIDPVFSNSIGLARWFNIKKAYEIPISIENLPPIDVVMITHNHYDHLDLPTLKKLSKLYKPMIITGLGVDGFLKSKGLDAHSLDWWDSMEVGNGVKVNYVPAQHWSSRLLIDKNETLWGGFMIDTALGSVYHTGDTGYCKEYFDAIAKRFPNIVLSFIPIGAYKPREIMKYAHMNPEEAVQAALDVNSKTNVAMHYDTFIGLADEGYGEAAQDLDIALAKLAQTSKTSDPQWFSALVPTSIVTITPGKKTITKACIESDDYKEQKCDK